MAYADLQQLKGRLGVLARGFSAGSEPSDVDLLQYLTDTAAEIDAAIAGSGFAVPVSDPVAANALAGWNADKAALLAIAAKWPGGQGPDAVSDLRAAIEKRLAAYDKAYATGSLAAIVYLRAQEEQGASGSASFWMNEQDYSPWLDDIESGMIQFIDGVAILRGPIGPEYHKGYTRF